MASFAEGLAKGLLQGEEIQDRRVNRERQQAITMATLANQAEELNYKRAERKKKEDAMSEINAFADDIYTVKRKVPNPNFGQDPNAPEFLEQSVRMRMGEDQSVDGRRRDAQFITGQMQIYQKYGLVGAKDITSALDYARAINKDGFAERVLGLYLGNDDPKAREEMGQRFNVKPETVEFYSKTGPDDVTPQYYMRAVSNNGATIDKPITPILAALGIAAGKEFDAASFAPKARAAALKKDIAATDASNASAEKSRADAASIGPYRKALGDAAESRASYLSQKDVKIPKVYHTMKNMEDKTIEMPRGASFIRSIRATLEDSGMTSKQKATDFADILLKDALAEVGQVITKQWEADPKNKGKKISSSEYNRREQDYLLRHLDDWLRHPNQVARIKAALQEDAKRTKAIIDEPSASE